MRPRSVWQAFLSGLGLDLALATFAVGAMIATALVSNWGNYYFGRYGNYPLGGAFVAFELLAAVLIPCLGVVLMILLLRLLIKWQEDPRQRQARLVIMIATVAGCGAGIFLMLSDRHATLIGFRDRLRSEVDLAALTQWQADLRGYRKFSAFRQVPVPPPPQVVAKWHPMRVDLAPDGTAVCWFAVGSGGRGDDGYGFVIGPGVNRYVASRWAAELEVAPGIYVCSLSTRP
jgi:hypothetical protein